MSDTWGKGAANNNIGWGQAAGSATNNWGESQKTSYAGQTDIVGLIALSISYSADNYCDDSGNTPQPTVSNNTGSGTFASTAGLIIDTNTGVINTNTSTAGSYVVTYTDTDADTATATVVILNLDNAAFAYSASSFEPTDADPTPTITGLTGGTFSGTTGLVINSTTGEIDLSASTVASHTITYDTTSSGSSVCPNTSTQTVDIALAGIANNYSMSFDGTDDYITISNPTELTDDFTIAAWIFPTRVNDSYEMIYTQGTAVSAVAPYFTVLDTKLHVYITGVYETGLNFITANQWQHVAVTRTSGVLNLYRNGVEYNGTRPTQNGTINNNSDGIIGKWYNSSHYFKGQIDEVGIWDTALTSSQVSEIYNATGTNLTKDLTTVSGSNLIYWNRLGD